MWIWILVHKVRCANGGTVFYYSTRWQDEKKKKKKVFLSQFSSFLNRCGVLCCVWCQGVRETVSLSHQFTGVE